MPPDPLTYWRATFTSRADAAGPKVTRIYIIALPRSLSAQADSLATAEVSPIFTRQTRRPAPRPLGGFVQITHPGRPHDLLSASGCPVWLDRWTGGR